MIRTLQALRFVFSLTVLLAHFSYAGIDGHSSGVSVCFFALLSGFLLSKAYGQRLVDGTITTGRYLLKRLIKLYPLHLLCLLVFIAIRRNTIDGAEALALVPNALLLQSWVPMEQVYFSGNAVSWYLSDALFFLLLFPWLFRLVSRLTFRQLGAACCAMMAVYVAYMLALPMDNLNYWLYIFPPVRLVDFTMGIMLWRLCQLRPRTGQVAVWPTAVELLLMAALVLTIVTYPLDAKWHVAFLHWLVVVPMLLVFYQGEQTGGAVSSFLKTPVVQWLGAFTMEMFLLHMILFSVAMSWAAKLGADIPYALMMLLCFSVVIGVSYVVHWWFVTPVVKWLTHCIAEK